MRNPQNAPLNLSERLRHPSRQAQIIEFLENREILGPKSFLFFMTMRHGPALYFQTKKSKAFLNRGRGAAQAI
jgi:hypothetical protein